jgi:hypothetical protein
MDARLRRDYIRMDDAPIGDDGRASLVTGTLDSQDTHRDRLYSLPVRRWFAADAS